MDPPVRIEWGGHFVIPLNSDPGNTLLASGTQCDLKTPFESIEPPLPQSRLHDFPVNVSQAEVAALEAVGQASVVEPRLMQVVA